MTQYPDGKKRKKLPESRGRRACLSAGEAALTALQGSVSYFCTWRWGTKRVVHGRKAIFLVGKTNCRGYPSYLWRVRVSRAQCTQHHCRHWKQNQTLGFILNNLKRETSKKQPVCFKIGKLKNKPKHFINSSIGSRNYFTSTLSGPCTFLCNV